MLTRRDALAALASAAALPLMSCSGAGDAPASSPATRGGATDPHALKQLDAMAEGLLRLQPEVATSLGVDTGARAPLRSQLADRTEAGKQRLASEVRADLDRVQAIDTSTLSHSVRTSVEVVRSAYTTAADGFTLPYGDITVGGWRNTPYVVIQNVGAYLDIPRYLDSDHPIETAADAEAYLARLQSFAKQLDGELGRIQAARAAGVVPPAFLLDKAIAQMTLSVQNARAGGSVVESIERRTKSKIITGDWAARARAMRRRRLPPRWNGSWRSCARSARSPPGTRASRRVRTARTSTAGRSRHRRRRR